MEQAQSEVAAAEAQLAAAEAAEAQAQAAAAQAQVVEAQVAPTVDAQSEQESPETVAQRRLADGTARPDGREPSTIPEPRVESQDA